MDVSGRGGMKAWTPLFFSLVLISGMILGFNLRDSLRSKRDITSVIERNDRLEQVIDLVNEKYVDSVKSDRLYQDAISGILKSLDPHTVYIPAEDLQTVTDDLEGGFSGIGVEFSIIRDTINVVAIMDNSPAGKAGIKVGDQFIKVGDSTVAGVNITTKRITSMLKGKQKSKVSVAIKHYEVPGVKDVVITRDIIRIHPVEVGLMLDNSTGYIKIDKFSADTHKEVSDALTRLKKQGARQMIIDLRGNPGGYLNEATSIADEFIDDDKLIVYTQGTHASKTEYNADHKGAFEQGKLVVLIDESSASASEILAGAIQDWDRGLIVGRRSFGKGLVQEPFQMTDGSELRLTIARYYTPSGRCIQRSFQKGKDAYNAEYEKRFEPKELYGKDAFVNPDTTRYYTSRHRIVYGGGGIKPDVFVPYDSLNMSLFFQDRISSPELKNAIWDYFLHHQSDLNFKNVGEFKRGFANEDEVLNQYLANMHQGEKKKMLKNLRIPVNLKYLKTYIKAQLGRYMYNVSGYYAISLTEDKMVTAAMAALDQKSYSKLIGGK